MKSTDYSHIFGKKIARNLSDLADQKICSLYQGHTSSRDIPWTIIAIGGYGRQELCPNSDLDILVLLDKRIPAELTKEILASTVYPLWDEHFSVSYSVRTIKNVLKDIKYDFFLKTSLLDVRLVCGSEAPYKKLFKAMQRHQKEKEKKEFLQTLVAHTDRREHDFGDVGYMLEPNLKDGRGGLRDMQEIAWLSKIVFGFNDISELAQTGFLSAKDLSDLDAAHDYILKARYILHCLVQHKTDTLFVEHQESLSRQLYPDGESIQTTREMMQEIHNKARIIKSLHDIIVSYAFEKLDKISSHNSSRMSGKFVITKDQIGFTHSKTLLDNPAILMQAFELMAEKNLSLKPLSLQQIREHAESGKVRTNETSIRCFFNILRSDQPGPVLIQMLELGILEKIIPEFTLIKGLTMGNSFHRFTVDLHSIQTFLELKKLEQAQPEIFEMVRDTTPLYLSALLHDIGKISTTNHEEHGAEMAKNTALELGLSEQDSSHVGFLVRNHLQFSITALRRDLSEESVVFLFAQKIGDPQRLAMLYLLSVADALATS
ncbi:MAG: HD domain-containing protein, partial [Deltaproteobacteria bacterium]|nr:HD domain-containing protein [Deltaproteobacteria bacterium]